jgi:DNA polymerase-1
MPDELRAQVEPMMEIVAALGMPDPARARRGSRRRDRHAGGARRRAGIDVTISTGDKDFAQLVRPHVALVNTMSGSQARFRRSGDRNSACAPTRSSITWR